LHALSLLHMHTHTHTTGSTRCNLPVESHRRVVRALAHWRTPSSGYCCTFRPRGFGSRYYCNTLHHTATLRSTLQHAVTHCNALQHQSRGLGARYCCNILQHTTPHHCFTLQPTGEHLLVDTVAHIDLKDLVQGKNLCVFCMWGCV